MIAGDIFSETIFGEKRRRKTKENLWKCFDSTFHRRIFLDEKPSFVTEGVDWLREKVLTNRC